jgi:hypothetical protein
VSIEDSIHGAQLSAETRGETKKDNSAANEQLHCGKVLSKQGLSSRLSMVTGSG